MSDRGSFNAGLALMGRIEEAQRHIRRGALTEAYHLLCAAATVLKNHGAEDIKIGDDKSIY